jgi:hypothetical protein
MVQGYTPQPSRAEREAAATAAMRESEAERAERARREEAQAAADAEAMTAELPLPGSPVIGAMSPEQAAANADSTVSMTFPHAVTLTTDNYAQIHYPPGVHDVPAEYAEHDWLKVNEVKPAGRQRRGD